MLGSANVFWRQLPRLNELPVLWFNSIAEHARTARAMGVFIVEIGVFVGVVSTLVILFDYLTLRLQNDD
mgnify:CR=1 FL=1